VQEGADCRCCRSRLMPTAHRGTEDVVLDGVKDEVLMQELENNGNGFSGKKRKFESLNDV
jgi:hypothetical protein